MNSVNAIYRVYTVDAVEAADGIEAAVDAADGAHIVYRLGAKARPNAAERRKLRSLDTSQCGTCGV